jgi:hypothetical protein
MPPYDNIAINGGGSYIPPDYTPPDDSFGGGTIPSIADMVGGVTPWRAVNFAAKEPGSDTLNGTFQALSVSAKEIVLADPTDTSAAWLALGTDSTVYFSPTLSTSGERWVGPFTINLADCDEVVANFVCPQGLFRTNQEGKPRGQSVSGVIEVTPVNADGTPRGAAVTTAITLSNNPVENNGDPTIDKSPRGKTLTTAVGVPGRVSVRFRRTTPLPEYHNDQFVDGLIIRDCYGLGPVGVPDFGNITTVQTRIRATSGATSVKERKLACVVTRKLPQRNIDDTFGPVMVATRSAADILCAMALDPFIGGRTLSELDVPNIYDTIASVQAYFGFDEAGFFDATFDDDNISFEEMAQAVSYAVFCNAYRQGNVIRLFFEQATTDSSLLFNHRNKLPGSETRTIRFGNLDDQDGVQFDYQDADGEKQTVFVPDDGAIKPRKLERQGVTDERVATLQAWRAWNKIRYQNTTVEFDALAEASQLVLNERIEAADNTRADVFDGYVVSLDGLTLELSQPFEPEDTEADFLVYLQLPNGTVDVIPVAYVDVTHVTLTAPPAVALALDENNSADVPYQIVVADSPRSSAFLVAEKGAFDKRSVKVLAINYDDRYYSNDSLYLP